MWGCWRLAVVRISERNRSIPTASRQFRLEDLDGDPPTMLQVVGEIDGCHAALAQPFHNGVPVLQGGSQTGHEVVGHASKMCCAQKEREFRAPQ